MRTVELAVAEYYHIFNRGVDKRPVFLGDRDRLRFLQCMRAFNDQQPMGRLSASLLERAADSPAIERKPLVNVICYCLNPNHYHFLLEQVAEAGVEKFMHRLGTGYTKYFNTKNQRTGSLFQGPFKAIRIDSDGYLLHVSAYINLNMRVHRLGPKASTSSWEEYTQAGVRDKESMVKSDIILNQFSDHGEYRSYAEGALRSILARRGIAEEILAVTADFEA